jgi:protein involved in polysaccharide export with SLBB domain
VKSLDGSSAKVDLAMFLATGDLSLNPYLKMGDVVHVPYRTHEVFVYGSVNEEGAQEFKSGDTVGDLLTLAGDVSGSAPLEIAVIWRFRDGRTSSPISLIDTSGQRSDKTVADIADVPLQSKDMLFVRTRADWQLTPTVHIHGEVKYRGRYRIVRGQTRIRDVVDLAGGINEGASLSKARVIRARLRNVRDPEFERVKSVQQAGGLGDLDPEERAYLKSKSREERGRVTVDFEKLLKGDESQDILLEGGDVIFIPEKRHTVSLSGQLKKPGLIYFKEGRNVSFYLDQAGGYGFKADKRGARLIRARTGQREKLNKNLIVDAGDEIWVPQQEYVNLWKSFQGLMRTVAETLTLVILVRAL